MRRIFEFIATFCILLFSALSLLSTYLHVVVINDLRTSASNFNDMTERAEQEINKMKKQSKTFYLYNTYVSRLSDSIQSKDNKKTEFPQESFQWN